MIMEKDDMKSRFTQRALPLQEVERGHDAMKSLADLAESLAASKGQDGQKQRRLGLSVRRAIAFALRPSLVLTSSVLSILLMQSAAEARDFSSPTTNPHQSYTGVKNATRESAVG